MASSTSKRFKFIKLTTRFLASEPQPLDSVFPGFVADTMAGLIRPAGIGATLSEKTTDNSVYLYSSESSPKSWNKHTPDAIILLRPMPCCVWVLRCIHRITAGEHVLYSMQLNQQDKV
jgi:hypothetical protein